MSTPLVAVVMAAASLLLLGDDARARPKGGGAAAAGAKGASAAAGPRIELDKSKVDLQEHRLELKVSPAPSKVKIRVVSESEATLAEEEHDFKGRPAGAPLIVTWSPSSDAPVGKIEIRAYDIHDRWTGVELSPWSVNIPHDDVNFRTGLADIDGPEVPKLEDAFAKIVKAIDEDKSHGRQHPNMTLYIAGHTDTVGDGPSNVKLSQARARSIGGWFRTRGVKIPIAFEGFGESSPRVRTPDNTDEVRNRRADYVLTDDPPSFKTSGFRPSWKRVP